MHRNMNTIQDNDFDKDGDGEQHMSSQTAKQGTRNK